MLTLFHPMVTLAGIISLETGQAWVLKAGFFWGSGSWEDVAGNVDPRRSWSASCLSRSPQSLGTGKVN